MKRVIRLGDSTSHGGTVVSANARVSIEGKAVALVGDHVTCPINGHGPAVIVEDDQDWSIDGKAVTLVGHKTSCGATLIASMPIAGKS
jgi:uncharacterized Zn-binding protein involved in type VI secretion